MAIEPLGSIMTVQAQTQVQPKPAAQPAKSAAEYTDVTAQDVQSIDGTISIVEGSKGKDESGNNAQGNENRQPTNEQIKKAVETMNKKMSNSEAIFGIHEGTNRITIKIIDKDTKEVLKELPPEKTLNMIAKVWEMAGILVDERR